MTSCAETTNQPLNTAALERWRRDLFLSDILALLGLDRIPGNLCRPWLIAAWLVPICAWSTLNTWIAPPIPLWERDIALFLFSMILWQPIIEELLFRGLLQGILLEQRHRVAVCGPLSAANLLTSVLFALAHLFTHPWMWSLGIFLASLAFGYARERTGSLYPAIFLHCYGNAIYCLLAAY